MHRARNLPGHAAPEQRAAVAAVVRTILARDTEAGAFARRDKVSGALRAEHDRPGAPMDASREDVLAYTDYPEEHRARIAGTNPPERVNEEIERRADVAGIFPNDEAVVRLVGAPMLEQPDERAVGRRYLGLGSLARLADTDPHGPPASAA